MRLEDVDGGRGRCLDQRPRLFLAASAEAAGGGAALLVAPFDES
jgi:hypothetical protein